MTIVTHYETIRVSRNAPDEIIHAAFRALAQKYHPDKNTTNPEAVRMMQLINISYKVLSDPQKRQEHDLALRQQEAPPRELTPKEREIQVLIDKAAAEVAAWTALATKAAQEVREARTKATEATDKAAKTPEKDRAKWSAWAAQAATEAQTAEKKEQKILKDLAEARKKVETEEKKLNLRGGTLATHYETLKVARNAPAEVIRAVHRAWVQKYHPDHDPSPEAAHMMQTLNEAYKILSDPQKRADHDNWIQRQEPQTKTTVSREPSAREKEYQAKAEKAEALAAAAAAWADKAAAQAKEAQDKADKAAREAQEKSNEKDAAAWAAWATKLAGEATIEKKKAADAAAMAATEKRKAAQATAEAEVEKKKAAQTAHMAATEAAAEKAMWAAAEKEK